ncbi:MAG: hypothetical protein ACT4PT_14195 [Methanobacteriota archaeon]
MKPSRPSRPDDWDGREITLRTVLGARITVIVGKPLDCDPIGAAGRVWLIRKQAPFELRGQPVPLHTTVVAQEWDFLRVGDITTLAGVFVQGVGDAYADDGGDDRGNDRGPGRPRYDAGDDGAAATA